MTHIQIPNVTPAIRHVGDGVETEFLYPFPIFADADLRVWLDDTEQLAGFSVAGAGESIGGSVTFDVAPLSGVVITLIRDVIAERLSDYLPAGKYLADTINTELDRLTAVVQQSDYAISRAITEALATPPGTASLTLPAPAVRAEKFLSFDGTGSVTVATDAPASDVLYTDPPITLVDGQAAYALPAEVQSGLDEDNYRVRVLGGAEMTRGVDYTVAADVLTLTVAPTAANGLAGEQIEVELVRPAINGSAVQPGSVGTTALADSAVNGDKIGISGQALGDILMHDGTAWDLVKAPTADGAFYARMTCTSGPTAKVLTWEQGALLRDYSFPATNAAAVDLINVIADNDTRLTDSQGDEILTRPITIDSETDTVIIEVSAYASAPAGQVLRMGLFRAGATNSLKEDRVEATGGMQRLAIHYAQAGVTSGATTYSVRIGATSGGKLNQPQAGGRKGGGSIGADMLIREIRRYT